MAVIPQIREYDRDLYEHVRKRPLTTIRQFTQSWSSAMRLVDSGALAIVAERQVRYHGLDAREIILHA